MQKGTSRAALCIAILCLSGLLAHPASGKELERYGNVILKMPDVVAIVLTDPRPDSMTLNVYQKLSTGEVVIMTISPADGESAQLLWRAFATAATPQQRQTGLLKCGELLIIRAEAITAVLRSDVQGQPGTIARLSIRLDTKTLTIDVDETTHPRAQVQAAWDALTTLAGYEGR